MHFHNKEKKRIKTLLNVILLNIYYCYKFYFSFKAAFINPVNKGCGLFGLDFNSGWN